MARGKYAVKAANRLAQLDDELVGALRADIARLQRELAAAQAQLGNERREKDSRVIARAAELSNKDIARIKTEMEDLKASHLAEKDEIAKLLLKAITKTGWKPPGLFDKLIPILAPEKDDGLLWKLAAMDKGQNVCSCGKCGLKAAEFFAKKTLSFGGLTYED